MLFAAGMDDTATSESEARAALSVPPRRLTGLIAALAAAASGAGLFWPSLYSESALRGAMRGQDLVTLLCLPPLALAQRALARGSRRALPVWFGLMGYLAYTYTGAAFGYRFNPLFLVYIGLFALSIAALSSTLWRLRARQLEATLGERAPRGLVAGFLVLLAIVLGAAELGQIVAAWARGEWPALLAMSGGAGNFVYVLDLGMVVPLCFIAAHRIVRSRPGGALLSASLLVMSCSMGLSLLAMRGLQPTGIGAMDAVELAVYLVLASVPGLLASWLLAEWPSYRPSPSRRLDEWLPRGSFHDSIAVRSTASPAQLMQALARVRPSDMPLAMLFGRLRYLPGRSGSPRARRQASLDAGEPFLASLCAGRGSVVLEQTSDEIIIGTIGKLHQLRDQELIDLRSAREFLDFAAADHEKLAMSLRAERAGEHTWLILEHRTRATTAEAARRFALYFRVIRPAGAFVTRHLLRAAARIAERDSRLGGGLRVLEHS